MFSKYLEDKDQEVLTKFNENNQTYFEFNTYQSDHITQLNTAIDAYYNSLYDGYFKIKNFTGFAGRDRSLIRNSVQTFRPLQSKIFFY